MKEVGIELTFEKQPTAEGAVNQNKGQKLNETSNNRTIIDICECYT